MTDLGLPHIHSGKVRDIYAVGDDRLLMVASDRMSAFDVVMAEPIPHKGRVLTAMSAHWFDVLDDVDGRIMLCRKAEMLPIECIVRGYLSGSAWKSYRATGTMNDRELPAGLQ